MTSSPSTVGVLAPGVGAVVAQRSVNLDELDAKILRELLLGGPGLFRSERMTIDRIAQDLDAHRNTVALRLRRMREAGAFLPLTVTVDPSQTGLLRGALWVRPPPELRTESVLQALWLVEGLQLVVQYMEGWLVFVYGDDEATVENRASLVRHLCGDPKALWETQSWRDYPQLPLLELNQIDLGVIRLLLEDARRPLPRMARVLGVSSRTVERRFDRLTSSGAVMVLPSRAERISRLGFVHLHVGLAGTGSDRQATLGRVDALLPSAIFRNLRHPRFGSWMIAVTGSAELEDLVVRLRRVRGVTEVRVRLFLGFRLNPRWAEWLLRTLERKVRAGPASIRPRGKSRPR